MQRLAKKIAILSLAVLMAGLSLSTFTPARDFITAFAADQQGSALTVSYYPLPSGGDARQIAHGSDGNVWFTIDKTGERNLVFGDNTQLQTPVRGSIGRITPDGTITEFAIPSNSTRYIPQSVDSVSFTLTAGPDGNIWFTEAEANKIGKITPQGQITEYSLPDRELWPRAITAGPDGNLWVMTSGNQRSRVLNVNTNGTILKELLVSGGYGYALAFGPDGNLWFPSSGGIGRVTPDGTFNEFNVNGTAVVAIVSGSNNDLWLGLNGGSFARITTNGDITSYPTPGELAWDLAEDSDNNIWFKDTLAKRIRKIGPNGGDITTYSLSNVDDYGLWGPMVFGPDGNIWVSSSNRIAKIDMTSPSLTPTAAPTSNPTSTPTQGVMPTASVTTDPVEVTPTEGASPTSIPTSYPTPTSEQQNTDTPGVLETPSATATSAPTPSIDSGLTASATVTVTPTVTPNPSTSSPQLTLGQAGSTTGVGGPGDGLSDGRSDGRSDGKSSSDSRADALQAVLGKTTSLAKTGAFDKLIMNISGIFGMLFVGAGFLIYAQKKRKIS